MGKSSNFGPNLKEEMGFSYFCQAFEESIDYLLLHCEKTKEVWKLPFSLFGVSWVFPSSVRETLLE